MSEVDHTGVTSVLPDRRPLPVDFVQRAREEGWWGNEPIADTLQRVASQSPDQVIILDAGREVTSGEVFADAQRLARVMRDRLESGSVISFVLPNWHEAAPIYFAAVLSGMIVHPILPSLRETDLGFMLADARSAMVFLPAQWRGHDYLPMMRTIAASIADPPEVIVLRGEAQEFTAYTDLLAAGETGPDIAASGDTASPYMILYTSGTTGTPKAVLHSQDSIGALVRQIGAHWLVERGDTFFVPSPISHIGGSIYAFEMPLLFGTRALLLDKWDGREGLALCKAHSATHLAGAPTFLRHLLDAARASGERLELFKLFVCGGSSVPPKLMSEAAEWFPNAVATRVYGSTEVPVITVGSLIHGDVAHAAYTDGRLGLAELKFKSHPAAGSGEGEIWARAPQMLLGYLRGAGDGELFDAEGFYRTGDIGYLTDDGYLVISGRAKDIIIRNGENISPKEIEDILIGHEAVIEVAIVGLPDERTGERACAVVLPGSEDVPSLADLNAYLLDRGIARFKLPEQLEIWSQLPKNATGKVDKRVIVSELSKHTG